jgi:formylglycine-generating enzyme required for sulfatase activity
MGTEKTLHALPIGDMIEEFRIVRILGAGSFGIVYECQNTYLPETAAIKEFLPPDLAYRGADRRVVPLSDQTEETFRWARERFLQEAKTLWELAQPERHPNIVRVSRYCEANGTAYMFMEFEQGRPLSDILDTQGRLSAQELDAIFYPLLDGLERVHVASVLHRDIKPANILIRADGSPVLIDFGAARRVVAGGERSILSAYTPVYAALEQYHEVGDQGPWTDIYSLGATLYQAVTGRKPLSAAERLWGETQAPVAEECAGRYPPPILAALDKALEINPEDRPQSVLEWRRCLVSSPLESGADEATRVMRAVGPDEPTRVTAPPTAAVPAPVRTGLPSEPTPGKRRGRGAHIGLAIGVALGVLAASGVGLYYYRDTLFSLIAQKTPEPVPEKPVMPKPALSTSEPPQPPPHQTEPREPEKPPRPEPLAIPGTRFSDSLANGGSGPIMVWLPAGELQMGSPPEEADRNPDEQLHVVQISKPFAVGETEVTLGYYRQFVEATGYRPAAGSGTPCLRPDKDWQQLVEDWSLSWESPGYEVTDRYPVTCVSWLDARAFARWLSEQTGYRYRLPTELEWEYAARAGTSSSRFWGDDPKAGCRNANTADCDDNYTYAAPAGTFPPNAFGLRDMLGNLAEWTCSEYGKGYRGAETECSDETAAGPRVFRGGSWLDAPQLVRSAARDGAPPKLRLNTVGFRLVRTLDSASEGEATGTSQDAEKP